MKKAQGRIWYAVSTLIALERRKTARLLVFEDVHLFRARSAAEASRRGAAQARKSVQANESVTWNGEPVRVLFAGVRKVVSCVASPERKGHSEVATIHEGVQATSSQLIVRSKRDLKRLVEGEAVEVVYEE